MRRPVVTVIEEVWVPARDDWSLEGALRLIAQATEKKQAGFTVTAVGVRFERPVERGRLPPRSSGR